MSPDVAECDESGDASGTDSEAEIQEVPPKWKAGQSCVLTVSGTSFRNGPYPTRKAIYEKIKKIERECLGKNVIMRTSGGHSAEYCCDRAKKGEAVEDVCKCKITIRKETPKGERYLFMFI